jgi:hypothetical protein
MKKKENWNKTKIMIDMSAGEKISGSGLIKKNLICRHVAL